MPDGQIDLVKEARELLVGIPEGPWVRDGSIVSDHVEIDLRLDDEGDNWITVKGDEDEIVESIATTVIRTPELLKALCDEVDRLSANVTKFSNLADERHDLLSAEKRSNDHLREQLREQRRTITFWQQHIQRMGQILQSPAIDIDVEEAAKKLAAENTALREQLAQAQKPRMFPIQRSTPIRWELAQRAYDTYAQMYGTSQSLERLAERGGFGLQEFACLFAGHYPEKEHQECVAKVDAVGRLISELQSRLAQAETARDQLGSGLSVRDAQLAELRSRLAQVEQERDSAREFVTRMTIEKQKLEQLLVTTVIPYEALLMDAESRKWIAPSIWKEIESTVAAIRVAVKEQP